MNLRPACIDQLIQVDLLWHRLCLAQMQGHYLAFFTFFEQSQYIRHPLRLCEFGLAATQVQFGPNRSLRASSLALTCSATCEGPPGLLVFPQPRSAADTSI